MREEITHNFPGRIPLVAKLAHLACWDANLSMVVVREARCDASSIANATSAVEICHLFGLRTNGRSLEVSADHRRV